MKILKYKHYRQKLPSSCAIASIMMGLNFTGQFKKVNQKLEVKILKELEGNISTPNLLKYLEKTNLLINVYTELDYNKIQFKNNEKAELLRLKYLEYWSENNKDTTKENIIEPISQSFLKDLIDNNEIILINGIENKTPHMFVIGGYREESFLISDPLKDKKEWINYQSLTEKINAPLGHWLLTIQNARG